ncbi:MAG: PKD domain containing protein [Bacteroidetes bacterium 38_7]|nr:MAG: PKD domain containing protein [Bacteroidetes bacterium 38_7]HAL65043.1 hypothetical protein [Bacteroidales bacterium]
MKKQFILFTALAMINVAVFAQNQDPTQSVCQGDTAIYYVDITSGSTYEWTIDPESGGTILSGQTTNQISILWTGPVGDYTVSVVETDVNSCVGEPKTVVVSVMSGPNPEISGPAIACTNTPEVYSVVGSASSTYTWSVSEEGTITSGEETNTVTITWNSAGNATVSITESIGDCSAQATYDVTVNPTPSPSISGVASTCLNSTDAFTTPLVAGNTYLWSVTTGNTIFAGQGTNEVSITFGVIGTQTVTVEQTANGCTGTDSKDVEVHPLPSTSAIWHD